MFCSAVMSGVPAEIQILCDLLPCMCRCGAGQGLNLTHIGFQGSKPRLSRDACRSLAQAGALPFFRRMRPRGGKMDDITVVVGFLQQTDRQPETPQPAPAGRAGALAGAGRG